MPTNAELLLDTSAALARVDREHVFHASVVHATAGAALGLAGHARFETYSVLTRLAPPKRLSPDAASRLIDAEFPVDAHLSVVAADALWTELTRLPIAGGAVYDALVAAAAREAGTTLVSCDQRAERTYRAMGIAVVLAVR